MNFGFLKELLSLINYFYSEVRYIIRSGCFHVVYRLFQGDSYNPINEIHIITLIMSHSHTTSARYEEAFYVDSCFLVFCIVA